jgi:hypothetical protein
MADFPIRGLATLTFLSGPLFESEYLERWLKLGDEAFVLNPGKSPQSNGRGNHTRSVRFLIFPNISLRPRFWL